MGPSLLRYLQAALMDVLEVTGPDKRARRRRGKNDAFEAESAAHAPWAERRRVTPRSRDGLVESLRVLRACRKTAMQAHRIALQVIQTTIIRAPDKLRDQSRRMTRMQLIRTLAASRPDMTGYRQVEEACRISLRSLARRYLELHDEIADPDVMREAVVRDPVPDLPARTAVGVNSAAQLLPTAGDNPERLSSEAGFAALCGVSPVPASSGKTTKHSLNRGGDRAANRALHIIAVGRLRLDEVTQACIRNADRGWQHEDGSDPLPQALHRPRGLGHHSQTEPGYQLHENCVLRLGRASMAANTLARLPKLPAG